MAIGAYPFTRSRSSPTEDSHGSGSKAHRPPGTDAKRQGDRSRPTNASRRVSRLETAHRGCEIWSTDRMTGRKIGKSTRPHSARGSQPHKLRRHVPGYRRPDHEFAPAHLVPQN